MYFSPTPARFPLYFRRPSGTVRWNLALTTLDQPFVRPRARRSRGAWVSGVMVFATIVVLVDGLVGEHGVAASWRAQQDYAQGQAELARLRVENARLRERARQLAHDPRAIEELARATLGMIRRGEVLFIIEESRPAEIHRPARDR